MGEAIVVDDLEGIRLVEHLRRDVFGGTSDRPRQYLGEAQTCYLLKELPEWQGSWWISDDHDALRFARAQGLMTRETIDVVRSLVADGDLNADSAFDLMKAMAAADRSLRLPPAPRDL